MYHVFTGAPSLADIKKHPSASYHWEHYTDSEQQHDESQQVGLLPPATFAAASRRISRVYQNIIFQDEQVEESQQSEHDYTTLLSWPPTHPVVDETRDLGHRSARVSFLGHSASHVESQETEDSVSMSVDYSDSSSIARFPTFHFSLQSITSLSSLDGKKGVKTMSMVLAVLEVEGPDLIRMKKGADAGKQIYLLKMILGDEEGHVCKLTAWRKTAEVWGGLTDSVGVKRGDVVLLENVSATFEPRASTSLSASPYLRSQCQLCYRTMPFSKEDLLFRPDLRLGFSDPSVRKVEVLVAWFENMAGLNA